MDSEIIYEKALQRAIHFLKFRPRSIKEVKDNLAKKKISPEIIEHVIVWLVEQGFLNDREFAGWWVRSRTVYKPKSTRIIELELRQKGVAKELIEEAITKQQQEETEPLDEYKQARELVEKKIGKYEHLSRQEIYQKVGAFLARRGYSWEVIKRSIDDTLKNKYNS